MALDTLYVYIKNENNISILLWVVPQYSKNAIYRAKRSYTVKINIHKKNNPSSSWSYVPMFQMHLGVTRFPLPNMFYQLDLKNRIGCKPNYIFLPKNAQAFFFFFFVFQYYLLHDGMWQLLRRYSIEYSYNCLSFFKYRNNFKSAVLYINLEMNLLIKKHTYTPSCKHTVVYEKTKICNKCIPI